MATVESPERLSSQYDLEADGEDFLMHMFPTVTINWRKVAIGAFFLAAAQEIITSDRRLQTAGKYAVVGLAFYGVKNLLEPDAVPLAKAARDKVLNLLGSGSAAGMH